MTKCLYVDPNEMRKPGEIKFENIKVNQYQKEVKDVLGEFTEDELVRIYRDMWYIREFETMLNLIKTRSEYEGMHYDNPGPAHLGMGQEAAYVGQAFDLSINDFSFGSHRSHGEVLAKGLSAIEKLSDEELVKIMEEFDNGRLYKIIKENTKATDTKAVAREFYLYGFLAEIFAKETGFSKGLGGSMHAYFLPFGLYPNNAIVGGSAPIATGAALYKRANQKDGIVISNCGDGAIGCGPVYESMNFAAMDQLRGLWEEGFNGGLPIIYNIFNNSYGMGGQTGGETMAYGSPVRFAAGITPNQMHAERVDGFNPLAVIDAYRRKREIVEKGEGPVLLEVVTYRFGGHSPSDSMTYRTKEELEAWQEQDSIVAYGKQLVEAGVLKEEDLKKIELDVREDIKHAVKLSIDPEISPRMDLDNHPELMENIMFNNEDVVNMDESRTPEINLEDNPRIKAISRKIRSSFDKDGKAVSKNKTFQIRDGIFEALVEGFKNDSTLITYGEDVRDWGGAFAVYRGLTEALPYHRLFNSPISEAAIVGTAVGYAMAGGRAVVELMYADFIGRCGDEVFNQMAKWHAMSAGVLKVPVILRLPTGNKYGAQHSQDWSALCAHIPGLKVVYPNTPYDAKGLMNAALRGTDPVVFVESQKMYDKGEDFEDTVPEEFYKVEYGEPDVKRAGSDVTILTIGPTLYTAIEAAEKLEKLGVSAEVIDARSLVPFNYDKVIESVKKTGKIVLASDACTRGSYLQDLSSNITRLAFDYLDGPPVVVGAKNWITPAHELDHTFFPQADWIVDAIHENIMPIAGYTPKHNMNNTELLRENKLGV